MNKDGADPVLDFDFSVDYETNPAKPIVTLRTGSLSWNVRSDANGSPGHIGQILLDPTVNDDDFGVTIEDGINPGAADVGTINLTAVGWTGSSSIVDGDIAGKLATGPRWWSAWPDPTAMNSPYKITRFCA